MQVFGHCLPNLIVIRLRQQYVGTAIYLFKSLLFSSHVVIYIRISYGGIQCGCCIADIFAVVLPGCCGKLIGKIVSVFNYIIIVRAQYTAQIMLIVALGYP